MPKIALLGAGSTVFAKAIVGDCMLTPSLRDAHMALYDNNAERLEDSRLMLENLNAGMNQHRMSVQVARGNESPWTGHTIQEVACTISHLN